MYRRRQSLRRWAALLLLLWLFGVGAGVANACLAPSLVQPGERTASHGPTGGATPQALSSPAGHDHAGAGDASGPEGGHGGGHAGGDHGPVPPVKANCLDFCDKSTVSVTPLKSAVGEVDAHALPPQLAATVLQVPSVRAAPPWVPRRDGGLTPPIPIAFLRLAL